MSSNRRKPGTGLFILSLVAMAFLIGISISSLYIGYTLYTTSEEGYLTYLITGGFGLILVIYGVNKMRSRIIVIQPIEFNVMTVAECVKCGFKNVREFESGDYVLKKHGDCPKCEGSMLITSIYHEDKQRGGFF